MQQWVGAGGGPCSGDQTEAFWFCSVLVSSEDVRAEEGDSDPAEAKRTIPL